MRVLIDANILFPTVMREVVLDVIEARDGTPLWSARILEEWRRAAARRSPRDGEIAEIEIAAVRNRFPNAEVQVTPETVSGLSLPDPDDVHVLGAAIDGRADELLTMNLRDFPTNALSAAGVIRRDPDGFLLEQFHIAPDNVRQIVDDALDRAGAHGIDVSSPRAVMKRARLPRLGKALFA